MNANLKNETYKLAKSYMDSGEGVRIHTSENEIFEISGQERKNYESLRAVFINRLSDIVRVESLNNWVTPENAFCNWDLAEECVVNLAENVLRKNGYSESEVNDIMAFMGASDIMTIVEAVDNSANPENSEEVEDIIINISDLMIKEWNTKMETEERVKAEKLTPAEWEAVEALNHGQNMKNEFTNIGPEEIKDEVVMDNHFIKVIAPKKARRPKDIGYENKALQVTLTAKQTDFIRRLPNSCFYEDGLNSALWVDCLSDDLGGQFANKPMTVGAMVSTLNEKNLISVGKERREGRKVAFFTFTPMGQKVAKELGLK